MKKSLLLTIVALLAIAMFALGCKKEENVNTDTAATNTGVTSTSSATSGTMSATDTTATVTGTETTGTAGTMGTVSTSGTGMEKKGEKKAPPTKKSGTKK